MSNVKSLKLIIFAVIVLFVSLPFVVQSNIEDTGGEKRSDRIMIQLGPELSDEEMPAVGFLHDRHTEAMDGNCSVCHMEQEGTLVFKFKRTDEPASLELYHDGCISCHDEKKSAKADTGPLAAECRACHTGEPAAGSSWAAVNFDRSLHYIHEKSKPIASKDPSDPNNCSACHHQYIEETKETFFAKGKEESCLYCHKSEKTNDIRSIREASHDSCVACHQTFQAQEIAAGPVSCEGCHEPDRQDEFKVVEDVPRLERSQPDIIALTGWKAGSTDTQTFMDGVAFNHIAHEGAVDSCRTCHHSSLKSCRDCHTTDGGGAEGGFVSLAQAMHKVDTTRSCVGCHYEAVQSPNCAGCHAMMPVQDKKDDQSCKTCHALSPETVSGSDAEAMVQKTIMERTENYTKVPRDKIPETVEIGILSNEYMPSIFPHRKVVEAIFERVEDSAMANVFHTDQAGLCMGCHHNSPKTLDPPSCASCHSVTGSGAEDGIPGLQAAYHGQCIGCHQAMEIESLPATDCIKCHEVKK